MKPVLIISLICLLSACNRGGDDIAELQKEIQDLKAELKEAKDPEQVRKLQQQLRETAKEELKKEWKEFNMRAEGLRKGAKNKEDCDRVNRQIEEQEREILEKAESYQFAFGLLMEKDFGFKGGPDDPDTDRPFKPGGSKGAKAEGYCGPRWYEEKPSGAKPY